MEINILIEEGLEGCPEVGWLEKIAEHVLIAQSVDSAAELGLFVVGQEKIQELNSQYLGRDEPTDVLAFAMLPRPSDGAEADVPTFVSPPDGVPHLGEVIISYPQAVIQAEENRNSVKREIALLIVHGVLHLLGYDHDSPGPEQEMRAREAEILRSIEEKGY